MTQAFIRLMRSLYNCITTEGLKVHMCKFYKCKWKGQLTRSSVLLVRRPHRAISPFNLTQSNHCFDLFKSRDKPSLSVSEEQVDLTTLKEQKEKVHVEQLRDAVTVKLKIWSLEKHVWKETAASYLLEGVKMTLCVIVMYYLCLNTFQVWNYNMSWCKQLSSSHLRVSHTCWPLSRAKAITNRRLACDPWKGQSLIDYPQKHHVVLSHAHTHIVRHMHKAHLDSGTVCTPVSSNLTPYFNYWISPLFFLFFVPPPLPQHLREGAINLLRILLKRRMAVWIMHQFY